MKNILEIHYIFWLIVAAIFFAGGEFLSKKFALAPSIFYILLALAVYDLGILAWFPAILQKNQLSIVGVMWSVLSLLMTVLIGVFLFHEKLNVTGIIGIVFSVLAIAFLSFA